MRISTALTVTCCLLAATLAAQPPMQAPPGTFWLSDSVYMDMHPVTNGDYATFLYCLENFWNHGFSDSIGSKPETKLDMPLFQRMYRNSPQWRLNQQALFNRMQIEKTPYRFIDSSLNLRMYLLHENIRGFPVLGISLEQAVTFCKWRTDMVRMVYAEKNNTERKRKKHYGFIGYRLPQAGEWMAAYRAKGVLGKRLLNKQPEEIKSGAVQFTAYTLPVTEWIEPLDRINKLAVTANGKLVDMTLPPTENYSSEMGFRCSCDVKN